MKCAGPLFLCTSGVEFSEVNCRNCSGREMRLATQPIRGGLQPPGAAPDLNARAAGLFRKRFLQSVSLGFGLAVIDRAIDLLS
jgi:hypothetical protein